MQQWNKIQNLSEQIKAARRDYGTKVLVTCQSTSLHSLSHARITLFPAHQDVINGRIYISTIRRPTEFHYGFDLNHTNLVLSQVISSDIWHTLQFQAIVIGQETVFQSLSHFVIKGQLRCSMKKFKWYYHLCMKVSPTIFPISTETLVGEYLCESDSHTVNTIKS